MLIMRKIKAVERIFAALDKEINDFKQTSGVTCIQGCFACCLKPNIEATVLEFLPLAYHLYKTQKAEEVLDRSLQGAISGCMLCNPFLLDEQNGGCSFYDKRGLICRLFGFSTMHHKNGEKRLVTCKNIKQDMRYPEVEAKVLRSELIAPKLSDYYTMLYSIDPNMGTTFYPINEAIQQAIKTVLFHFTFVGKKAS